MTGPVGRAGVGDHLGFSYVAEGALDKVLGDKIPEFNRKRTVEEAGLSGLGSFGPGGSRTHLETLTILLVAVVIVGGAELLLWVFKVPHYIMPRPSQIVVALFTEWPFLWPHLVVTLYELLAGFAIGGAIGFVMAAVITQFPFVEKIVTPYILLLVTTPMIALVPLLILRFGFGSEPRIIAVALASGPMVMINSATGFRRVDQCEDRARALFRRKHAANLHQDPHSDGHADDYRRPHGRVDLRTSDCDRCGNGGRLGWARQPPDLLFRH